MNQDPRLRLHHAYSRGFAEWVRRWGDRRLISWGQKCICRTPQASLLPRGRYISEHLNQQHELDCAIANTAGDVLYYAHEAFTAALAGDTATANQHIQEAIRLEKLHAPIPLHYHGAAWGELEAEIKFLADS